MTGGNASTVATIFSERVHRVDAHARAIPASGPTTGTRKVPRVSPTTARISRIPHVLAGAPGVGGVGPRSWECRCDTALCGCSGDDVSGRPQIVEHVMHVGLRSVVRQACREMSA